MSAAGKRFFAWLAEQGCVKCGGGPVQLHHDTGCRSRKTGMRLPKRRGPAYYAVIPLCGEHHREREAIGRAAFEESLGMGEGSLTELMLSQHCWYLEAGGR